MRATGRAGERHRKAPAKASAPRGWAVDAAPSTIGTSGSTQGDRIEKASRAKANGQSGHGTLRLLSSSAAIEASLVSPIERPCSLAPLKTNQASTAFERPNCLTTGFWRRNRRERLSDP